MIDSFWIKSFRCLKEVRFSFESTRFISVVAKNNVGKTSLLEACYVLGHLNSFVSKKLGQVVTFDQQAALLGVKLLQNDRSFNYYLKIDDLGKKYITLNNETIRKKEDILSLFRVQYISSDSLFYISSNPSYRRQKLDQSISQFSYPYRKNLATYKRLILQKNQLLKTGADTTLISKLNLLLAPLMSELYKVRSNYLKAIQQLMMVFLAESSFVSADVDIIYHSKITRLDEDFILTELNNALPKERLAKVSIYGVHRDDFNFEINGKNVGLFFSRGICRIISYYFQLSEAMYLKQILDLPILLLLDEPYAEVHPNLKNELIQAIPSDFFKIYVTTQPDEMKFLKQTQLYGITDGLLCNL